MLYHAYEHEIVCGCGCLEIPCAHITMHSCLLIIKELIVQQRSPLALLIVRETQLLVSECTHVLV